MVRPTRSSACLSFAAVAALAACQPSFSTPAGAQLTCSGEDKCPSGMTCSAALGRCVVPGNNGIPLDIAGSPAWSTVVLGGATPITWASGAQGATAGLDSEVSVSFNVSQPLGTDPVVELKLPTGASRPFGQVSSSGLGYTFNYRIVGDEGAGTAAPVTAKLIDPFGNVASGQALGTVTFNFTAPGLAAPAAITPAVARPGAVVDIVLKPAASCTIQSVYVGGSLATKAATQPADGAAAWQFTIPTTVAAGVTPVTVDVSRSVGQQEVSLATGVAAGVITIDTAPPALAMAAQITSPMTHPGATLTVSLTMTEPLAAPPILEIRAGQPFAASMLSAVEYQFTYTVQTADLGTQTLTLSQATDLAGNVAAPITVGMITVADTPPSLATGSLTLTSGTAWMTIGGVVSVAFTTTGAVQTPVASIVLASGHAIAMTQMSSEASGNGTSYVFSHTIAAGDPQGQGTASVQLTDLYGNTAGPFTVGQFNIDTTPPKVLSTELTPTTGNAGLGTLLVVTLNTSEILSAATVASTPSLSFTPVPLSPTSTSAVFSHLVSAADTNGSYTVTATLTDRAGNVTTASSITVVLDTVLPTASNTSVTPPFATVGSTITATFDASVALMGNPVVLLGTVPMTQVSATRQSYVYSYAVTEADLPAVLPDTVAINAQLTDANGNNGTVFVGQVTIDTSLITPEDFTSTPNPAILASGGTLTITAQGRKGVGSAQPLTVLAPAGLTFGLPTVTGNTVTWTHTLAANDPTGPINILATLTDLANDSFTLEVDGVGTVCATAGCDP